MVPTNSIDDLVGQCIDRLCEAVVSDNAAVNGEITKIESSGTLEIEHNLLTNVSERFNTALNRRIAENRRQHNAKLPILCLPEEMTLQILQESLPPCQESGYFNALTAVSGACSSWKALIDATESLWARISVQHPLPVVAMALRKSANSPLQIHAPWHYMDSFYMTAFAGLVCAHTHRWSDVELRLSSVPQALINSPAPILQSLGINMNYNRSNRIIGLLGGYFPKLKSLTLHGVCLPWGIVEGLTYLRVALPPTITSRDVVGMLQQCPNLTFFGLDAGEAVWGMDEAVERVSLPALRGLQLQSAEVPLVHHLLIIITPPAYLETFCISFMTRVSDTGVLDTLQYMNRWQHCIVQALQTDQTPLYLSLGKMTIEAHTGNPELAFERGNYDVRFSSIGLGEFTPFGGFVSWHQNVINQLPSERQIVHLKAGWYLDLTSEELLAELMHLIQVTKLSVYNHDDELLESLYEVLSYPEESPGRPSFWLFPRMEWLKIHNGDSDGVLEVVRARLRNEGAAQPPAVNFKRLELGRCHRSIAVELSALLGDRCEITWGSIQEDGVDGNDQDDANL